LSACFVSIHYDRHWAAGSAVQLLSALLRTDSV